MTFKYNVNGVGLDQIFDPYISGTKAALTSYTVNGVDLKDIFAPIYLGSSALPTAYKVNNVDLNMIFAAKGTARYSLPIDGQTFNGWSSGTQSAAMAASATVVIKADGTYSVTCVGNSVVTNPAAGTWLPGGAAASSFQVQFGVTQQSQGANGPATITNGAASFVSCVADRSCVAFATTGQHGGLEIGGTYTVAIRLKNVGSGNVSTTTITFAVQSVGAA